MILIFSSFKLRIFKILSCIKVLRMKKKKRYFLSLWNVKFWKIKNAAHVLTIVHVLGFVASA